MDEKEARNDISIRNSIIIVFTVSIIVSIGFIGYIVFSSWVSSVGETTKKIAEDMNRDIFNQVDYFINIPEQINEVNRKFIENGILDLSNETEREKFFVSVLQSQDDYIYSFSYGTENGEYYGARRNENGVIEIMRNNSSTGGHSWYYSVSDDMTAGELVVKLGKFDPRTRDWYKAAKQTQGQVFSPIYKHFVMPDLTMSAVWPIYDRNGNLQGVLGTHIILSNIDNYLKKIVQDKSGYAIVIEKNSEELIANSLNVNNFITMEDGTMKRHTLHDIENQVIAQVYEQYKNTRDNFFLFETKSEDLYFNFQDYRKDGLNWVIITAIPESMLMSDITQNIRLTIVLAILAILLSVAAYYLITNKLIKPIDTLIDATEKLSSGDLSQRVTIIRNDEIGRISYSFNKMADTIHLLVNDLDARVRERTAELAKVNNELEKNKDQLRLILDSTAEAIYGIDLNCNCTFCNFSCIKLLGYKREDELIGKNMHWQIHHIRRDGTPYPINECSVFQSFNEGKGIHINDEVFWKADSSSLDVEYYAYPQYKDGKIIGAVVTFMDITVRKKNEEQIRYLSHHDPFTGLINRHYFEHLVTKYDTKDNLPISIIYADLNGLKLTNDIFGHASGDMLIKKSAEILKKSCRVGDIVARVGGDEFIALLPRTEASDAEKIIERVQTKLAKEKVSAVKCSMALGVDTKTCSCQEIERIIENAENIMYKEKSLSRKSFGVDTINTIMNTLHERSPQEKKHSEEVSLLCNKIAQAMGLPETEIKKIREAGYLHDIGKIVIDENILNKEDILSEDESQKMQQHSVVGYRILNLFEDTLDLADIVLSHHEKWDGTGYPRGLKGEEIPLFSRIISLAEYYERKLPKSGTFAPKTKENMINKLREGAGRRFDPALTELFITQLSNRQTSQC